MKILLLFGGRLGESRGTPSRARNMALWLARKPGVAVATLSGDAALDLAGVETHSLDRTDLVSVIAAFRPDIVYGHTHKALPALAAVPGILTAADLHGHPVAEKLEDSSRWFPARLKSALRLWWDERRYFSEIDGFTVVSSALERSVLARRARVNIVRGGVDPELFRESSGPAGDALVVGYAGNFRPYQGLPLLLDAAESLDRDGIDLRLVLAGDPGDTGLDREAKQRMPGKVKCLGQVPYAEVAAALADTNVLVIPRPDSQTARYGFPSKLPESMAQGKALVVTDVGDQARVVEHGVSGLVVPPDSAQALAAALRSLRSPDLRRELGGRARIAAETRLHWRVLTDTIISFFTELGAPRPAMREDATA